MAIHMAKTIKEERLRWVLSIVRKEISIVGAVRVCPYSKRSLERWVQMYRRGGEAALEPLSTAPKTNFRETPIWLKEYIVKLRKKTGLCALKLFWELEDEGIDIHVRTVGKILKREGLVRKYRIKKIKYKYIRAERKPGELIEIDVKYVPGTVEGKRYFQYTAIDTASRWRHLAVYEEQSTYHSIKFLNEVIGKFPYSIKAIKTDNGSIFTNYYVGMTKRSDMTVKTIHALDSFCGEHEIVHYLIDPGKPAQNGTVERSHREDQEKFYDKNTFVSSTDLVEKINKWTMYYNNLRHCGLNGKTPNQALADYQLTSPPYVRT